MLPVPYQVHRVHNLTSDCVGHHPHRSSRTRQKSPPRQEASTRCRDHLDRGAKVLQNERDIAENIVTAEDDPNLNPWSLRAFVIGIGMSAFGGVLGK